MTSRVSVAPGQDNTDASAQSGILVDPQRRISRRPGPSRGPIYFETERNDFVIKVYAISASFGCITFFQWIAIAKNQDFLDYYDTMYYITYLSAFSAIILLSVFAYVEEARYKVPYNWIHSFFIVEFSTFGMMGPVVDTDMESLSSCFYETIFYIAALSIFGLLIKIDLTQYILVLTLISLLFYVLMTILVILVVTADLYFPIIVFTIGIFVIMAFYIMYVAQLILGKRTGALRWRDYMLGSLMVYFCFLVMFIVILITRNAIRHL